MPGRRSDQLLMKQPARTNSTCNHPGLPRQRSLGTHNRLSSKPGFARINAFTLIEVLIVVVLISILMSVVVAAFSGVDQRQEFTGYMQRLALRFEMARDKAVQTNREWGVYVSDEGISFAQFDVVNGEWIPQVARPFAGDSYAESLEFSIEVESFEGIEIDAAALFGGQSEGLQVDTSLDGLQGGAGLGAQTNAGPKGEEEFPQLVLFSSGETTPFELTAQPREWETDPIVLHTDGFGRIKIKQPEDSF